MRFRITLRRDDPCLEIRGFIDVPTVYIIGDLASALEPLGILVIGSPAADDYNPFEEPS